MENKYANSHAYTEIANKVRSFAFARDATFGFIRLPLFVYSAFERRRPSFPSTWTYNANSGPVDLNFGKGPRNGCIFEKNIVLISTEYVCISLVYSPIPAGTEVSEPATEIVQPETNLNLNRETLKFPDAVTLFLFSLKRTVSRRYPRSDNRCSRRNKYQRLTISDLSLALLFGESYLNNKSCLIRD